MSLLKIKANRLTLHTHEDAVISGSSAESAIFPVLNDEIVTFKIMPDINNQHNLWA